MCVAGTQSSPSTPGALPQVCYSVLQCGAGWCCMMLCNAVWCSVLQCVAVCWGCGVMQNVAVRCSAMNYDALNS